MTPAGPVQWGDRQSLPVLKQFQGLLTTDKRWSIAVAHRRAGKTVACVQKLTRGAIECMRPQGRYAYVAPLYGQAKDVAWQYVKAFGTRLGAALYGRAGQ